MENNDQFTKKKETKSEGIQRVPSDKEIMTKSGLPLLKGKHFDKSLIEPVLFLMRSNGTIDVFEGVKSGVLKVDRGQDTGNIILSSQKLQSMKWGDGYLKCWIANEEDSTTYPVDPKHDSVHLRNIIQAVVLAYKNHKESDAMGSFLKNVILLAIALAIVMAAYGMFIMKPEVAPVIVQNMSNASDYVKHLPAFISLFR